MTASPLQDLQRRFGSHLEKRLQHWLALCDQAPGFAGMMRYQMGYADERLQRASVPRGKLFRPLLCLLACEAAGGRADAAIDAAAAIELLHNFSLVHDDIEDRDETRRHRATVWKLWGEAQGINVGDGLFALASRAVLAIDDPATAVALARGFGDTALLLTEGQYLDMSFETRFDVSDGEYLDMIEKKSAALVEYALWSGARIAQAPETVQSALRRFGQALGTAFQIHDDIMGIWGRSEVTGKRTGTDLENRKKTLPVLLGSTRAHGKDGDLIHAYLSGAEFVADDLRECLLRVGARDAAEEAVAHHLAEARTALRSANLDDEHERQLQAVADELTDQRSATSSGIVTNR